MSLSKSRLLAIGLAGLAGAAALGVAAHLRNTPLPSAAATGLAAKAPVQVAEKQTEGAPVAAPGSEKGRSVRVEAPSTSVDVDQERGKVRVRAPHTDVHVDPDKGRVQVRAPYVDLDIRW